MKIFLSICVLLLAGNAVFAQPAKASEIRLIILKDEGGFGVDKGFEILLERGDLATLHGGRNFYGRKGDYRGAFDEVKIWWRSNLKTLDEQIESFFDLRAFNFDDAQARLSSADYQMIL